MDKALVCEGSLLDEIIRESGVNPHACYQCGKCSGSCFLTSAMDYSPSTLIRLLQVGRVVDVLKSKAIWLCTGCSICSARCPQLVDLPGLIRQLCITAQNQNFVSRENEQAAYHGACLHSIHSHGRLFETGVRIDSLLSSTAKGKWNLTSALVLKRKVNLFPRRVKGRKQILRIFKKTLEAGEGQ